MGICSIGCFGKLPVSHDFIRYNADGDELRWLDEWFQEGIAMAQLRLGKDWMERFEKMGTWSFVFCPQDEGRWMMGLYAPSRDSSGRQYPFVVCVFIARLQVPGYLLPMVLAQVLENYRAILERHNTASVDELVAHLKMVALPEETDFTAALKQYCDYLSTNRTRSFWIDLFGDVEDSGKYLIFWNLWRLLHAPGQQGDSGLAMGLRFPLMRCAAQPNADVAVWVQLVAAMIKKRDYAPTLFWNRDPSRGGQAFILPRASRSPRQFTWLLDAAGAQEGCIDLLRDEKKQVQELKQRMGSSRTQLLQQEELSLAAFLQTIEGMP